MKILDDNRIKLGVSSCLLGENVRYDGGHRLNELVITTIGDRFELIPFCPEAAAGFGVPREPVQLTEVAGEIRMLGRESGLDRTDQLQKYIVEVIGTDRVTTLSGFILKAKSPSCGGDRVKLFGDQDTFVRQGIGLFAKALIERYPDLPTIDEKQVVDQVEREKFLDLVVAYYESRKS